MILRKVVSGLLGYEQELERLRQRVQDLSWDEPFGMWTRKAFLARCEAQPPGRRLISFLDLTGLGDMNLKWGYTEVDRRVEASFHWLSRGEDLVARWYSGDEIVILFSPGQPVGPKIKRLAESALANGISYHMEIADWEAGREPVRELIERLSNITAFQKLINKREEAEYEIKRYAQR